MASIQRRGKKYCVVYRYQDEEGKIWVVKQSKDGKKMITIYSCLESFEPDGKVRSD